MKKIKNILLLPLLLFIFSCGYTPLLDSKKINFYIGDLILEGDREINKYIFNSLKKYQTYKDGAKKYDLQILSKYEKIIANKDEAGNPKNYNLKLKINVNYNSIEGVNNKIFETSASLAAKDKKIKEKEFEKKYKKDLSIRLGEDIIFFLKTK